jgi:hypothetical protein
MYKSDLVLLSSLHPEFETYGSAGAGPMIRPTTGLDMSTRLGQRHIIYIDDKNTYGNVSWK